MNGESKRGSKKPKRPVLIQGFDLSLNHGAVVQLSDGDLDKFWYYTTIAGSASRSTEHGFRINMPTPTKQPDKHIRSAIRLNWVARWIANVPLGVLPNFVGLEDYALGADQGAHYMGEIGGHARNVLWACGIPYRLHDPNSVKMFVAHDGSAQKDLIEECVSDRWGVDFSEFNAQTERASRQTSEDLADAFGIAKMVWTEYLLRKGKLSLSNLHEKEIRVFNRTTKAHPINILGRDWIRCPT